MTEKEKTLLAGCIAGEKAGWEQFVRQYSNLVYHTIRKTLTLHHSESHAETVEDLYQGFFVSIPAKRLSKAHSVSRRRKLYTRKLAESRCIAPDD